MKRLSSWLLLLTLAIPTIQARTFKIATQAPQGTSWANSLQQMVQAIAEQSESRVQFKVYYGGVSGDEPDVLRKIRIGQLHGALFTGRTLGHIHSDTRIIELPFAFRDDRAQASRYLREFTPLFNRGIESQGFKNLGFFEIGKVYLVSTKKVENIAQLKGMKTWTWEGDEVATLLAKEMELAAVPLNLPDVLTALSTGVVDAAYASPLGILALQWGPKIKFLVDAPVVYSIGGFLLSLAQWNKVRASDRTVVEGIVADTLSEMNETTARQNEQALQALSTTGVETVRFPQTDIPRTDQVNRNILSQLQAQKIIGPETAALYKKLKQKP